MTGAQAQSITRPETRQPVRQTKLYHEKKKRKNEKISTHETTARLKNF